jgi:hypothetical protein
MTSNERIARIFELRQQIDYIREEIERLRRDEASEKFGLALGDIVEYRGRKYKIDGFCSTLWPTGKRVKEDGSTLQRTTNLCDFRKAMP